MKRIIYCVLMSLMAGCTCANSNTTSEANESAPEQVVETIESDISQNVNFNKTEDVVSESTFEQVIDAVDNEAQEEGTIAEDDYILTPGITYVTESAETNTDAFGGKVSLSMEFTIYKDGTATGNLIETTEYGNRDSYSHPVEGRWEEVSKHDKRFLKIDLELEAEDFYKQYTYYIDENLNAYANNINTRPVQLIEK